MYLSRHSTLVHIQLICRCLTASVWGSSELLKLKHRHSIGSLQMAQIGRILYSVKGSESSGYLTIFMIVPLGVWILVFVLDSNLPDCGIMCDSLKIEGNIPSLFILFIECCDVPCDFSAHLHVAFFTIFDEVELDLCVFLVLFQVLHIRKLFGLAGIGKNMY